MQISAMLNPWVRECTLNFHLKEGLSRYVLVLRYCAVYVNSRFRKLYFGFVSEFEALAFTILNLSFPKCNRSWVSESHMAPSRYTDHPYTVCRACPCMSVFNKNLTTLTIKYIPSSPALMLPKIKNLLQNFCQVDMAIFSMDASSIKWESDPSCNTCDDGSSSS